MAPVPHLAWDGLRERNRKGRKLPGEVLQRFKNLSSHSAEVSDANNRFGTWPACTGGSAAAALWSEFPTFDGCAVSRNSWRRGAPAECTSWGAEKTTREKEKKRFLCEADTHLGSARARRVMAWGALHQNEQILLPTGPPHSQRRAREKVHHVQCNPRWRSGKSSILVGLSNGFATSYSSQRHFSIGKQPPRAPPGTAAPTAWKSGGRKHR